MKRFTVLERVRKTITRYNMLPRGARLAVAVSGGADSTCLLCVLLDLAAEYGVELSVAHFNHQLRGAESAEDEGAVAELAGRLHLPFYRAEGDVAAVKDNLEQAARLARRRFFADLMATGKVDCVALGHTRDDQAETVLFRFLRGAGLAGLAGIYPATTDGYIRPLIDVTRAEVEAFLRARGIAWREDSTNLDLGFARNRIRRVLLPQLAAEWNPRIRESLVRMADLAHEEERWWRGHIEGLAALHLKCRAGGVEVRIGAVAPLPLAIKRRLIRRALALAKGNLRGLNYAHVEQVLELLERPGGDGRLRLPGPIDVRRSFDWIRISPVSNGKPEPWRIPLGVPGAYPVPGGAVVHLEVARKNATLRAAELSLRRLPATLELRGWRPGDQYCPVGRVHRQKVKEMFQMARIPSWQRRDWPIVSHGPQIVWARGFGAAAEFAAGREPGPVLRVWEVETKVEEGRPEATEPFGPRISS
jgi:tRNA(Ile)-lysidine synthase